MACHPGYEKFVVTYGTCEFEGQECKCNTLANLRFIFVSQQDWPPTFDSFEKVFYFWTIFVFGNTVWIVVPTKIMLQTLSEMGEVYNPRSSAKKHN